MKRACAGFTLLELLVSITIFALLMVVLIGALQLGTRQTGRLTGQVDRSQQVALVQNFLRTQLGTAQPLVLPSDQAKTVQFDGQPHSVDFVALAPESLPAGGLQVLSLALVEDNAQGDGRLVLGWRPLRQAEDASPAASRPTVLLEHVRAARFVYYGPPTPTDDPYWQTTWQNMTYLPLLVRLSVTFLDGEQMPDLAIALRLSSSVADLRLNQNRRF
ncbi:MAG: prepilin-type N-terminal cleavage/methylation domain-containing protein [Alphaproteobacteria bacterium]|nr:prepilin-type N-terminal cleavage/methylation domain-containing protein [Alphaproteobacteria bacterium]